MDDFKIRSSRPSWSLFASMWVSYRVAKVPPLRGPRTDGVRGKQRPAAVGMTENSMARRKSPASESGRYKGKGLGGRSMPACCRQAAQLQGKDAACGLGALKRRPYNRRDGPYNSSA